MRPGAAAAAAINALFLAGLLQLGSAARLVPAHGERNRDGGVPRRLGAQGSVGGAPAVSALLSSPGVLRFLSLTARASQWIPHDHAADSRSLLMAEGVWQNYTRTDNTVIVGPRLLSSGAATSDVACAEQCNADAVCVWWSWCPLGTADG